MILFGCLTPTNTALFCGKLHLRHVTKTMSLSFIQSVSVISLCISSQADGQVETMRNHFQEESLDYVCKLQEIQERKKFECVEPVRDC